MTRTKPFIETANEERDLKIYQEPTPGNTDRPKAAKPKPKPSRPRKPLDDNELQTAENELRQKYPHIVEGSLLNATKGQPTNDLTDAEIHKYRHKRSIIIKCTCGTQRRIATSDLAQVTLCEDCTREDRNRRKRERRAHNE